MISYRYQKDIKKISESGEKMSKDRVQIIIRVMPDEKELIQELAKEEDKSMNQFIVDRVLPDPNLDDKLKEEEENHEDLNVSEEESLDIQQLDVFKLMRNQIHAKDKQIDKLQILLDQQQQLNLSDKRENERLRTNIEELELEYDQQDQADASPSSEQDTENSPPVKEENDSQDPSPSDQTSSPTPVTDPEVTDTDKEDHQTKDDSPTPVVVKVEEKEDDKQWWKFWK